MEPGGEAVFISVASLGFLEHGGAVPRTGSVAATWITIRQAPQPRWGCWHPHAGDGSVRWPPPTAEGREAPPGICTKDGVWWGPGSPARSSAA